MKSTNHFHLKNEVLSLDVFGFPNQLFFIVWIWIQYGFKIEINSKKKYYEMGLRDNEERNLPTKIPFFQNKTVIDVTTGYGHSLFVIDNFTVFVVGDNRVKN
jgi:hypothetical protein